MNIIGTPKELPNYINYLKTLFEMKDLGKTKSLQGEHLDTEILYTKKVI